MCQCLRCDFCRSTMGGLQIPLPTALRLGKFSAETNVNFPAPPFNHISGICKNLADTWPAATRVLSRGRERTLGTRLLSLASKRWLTILLIFLVKFFNKQLVIRSHKVFTQGFRDFFSCLNSTDQDPVYIQPHLQFYKNISRSCD